jgi:type II secretory ATPase GspE/PulE/Tfp pilus assembly ATPase PilB-like protein
MVREIIYQKNKFEELLEAIKAGIFPILVFGPTGAGKTFSILKALESLKIRHKFVEFDNKPIHRPIDNNLVVVICINDQKYL